MRHRDDVKRVQYTVKCPCGGAVTLDARGFGRNLPCQGCKGAIIVAWGRDAKNTETIPVVVRHVPAAGKAALPLNAPAHRPVMKTQILPQAKFFECPCGERNVLMGKGVGASVNCPGCDRVHVLEAADIESAPEAAPPPPPVARAAAPPPPPRAAAPPPPPPPPPKAAPVPPPPPPPPPAPARKLGLGEILCKCGEILPPRTSRTGREFECKVCGRKGHVVPGQDGKGLPVINAVFTHEPAAAAMYKPPPPVPRPPVAAGAAAVWTCPCGTTVPAHVAMAGKVTACPSCGREIRLEKRHAPHSTMTQMRPVFVEVKSAEFQELPESTAACPCGADLPVSEAQAGQTVSCGDCSRALEVVAKDGRVRLRERS